MAKKKNRDIQKQESKVPGPPKEQGRVSQSQITATRYSTSFSGPIPPPDLLEKYEKLLPGATDRIVKMAEKEQDHQHALAREMIAIERSALNKVSKRSFWGLVAAFVVTMSVIAGAIYLLATGKDVGGLTALIGALVMLVGLFIYGKKKSKPEQQKTDSDDDRQLELNL